MDIAVLIPLLALISGALGVFISWITLNRKQKKEARQGTKYGIQSANVEINGRFWVHGTTENPEPVMSSFTMSRGTEVYVNLLLTVLGCYDYKDKELYSK